MIEIMRDFYPYVNEEKCIKCEVCIKHCPQLNNTIFDNQLKNQRFMLQKKKKENILMKSSSGGMFSAIAERVIDKEVLYLAVHLMKI